MIDLAAQRKRRGAWSTPAELVERIVEAVVTPALVARWSASGRIPCVVDPACGDGRFLAAVGRRTTQLGVDVELVGVDIDADAVRRAAAALPHAHLVRADALAEPVLGGRDDVDLVIGNPPFLSQLASGTSRGGASRHGGGPYADAAVEFLALAARLVDPSGGRVAFVLPQSVLSSRDAAPVRRTYAARASMVWSWWSPEHQFDAGVVTCALAFEFGPSVAPPGDGDSWAHVITRRRHVPPLPPALSGAPDGTLGDRARLNANFRDEYYGLVPAVGDHPSGPPLVTSGSIDPGRCWWGARPVRFAKRTWAAPRVDLGRLDERMRRWAHERLVPKVLVANQTAVVEAVCDPDGAWLPGVPVVTVYPAGGDAARAWEVAAVLTSPAASAWTWHRQAGTGLSAGAIRIAPAVLAALPWPPATGRPALRAAVDALRDGDVRTCGARVDEAYGLSDQEHDPLRAWWTAALDRLDRRRPPG